jgi:hypothetical protein
MKKKGLNKIKQRDKKRNPYGMRVDYSARTLAQVKERKLKRKKVKFLTPLEKAAKWERSYGVTVARPKVITRPPILVRDSTVTGRGTTKKPIIKKVIVKAKVQHDAAFSDGPWNDHPPVPQAVAVPAPTPPPAPTDPLKEMVKAGKITQKDLDAYNRST